MAHMPKTESLLKLDIAAAVEQVASDSQEKPPASPRVPKKIATPAVASFAVPNPALELNTLFKFIKSYDGSRETFNSFLVNCENAYDLASASQKSILFKYILSQLKGKAETACSIKEFSTWEQLKEFLKTQFSERKHLSHLLTDLQESKQGPQENVSQYALRVETCLSQLLTEISLSSTKAKELPGRIASMEDLALHHFLMGLYPRLSNIVRCRSPKNLNEAINLAVSEERIQQTIYKRSPLERPAISNNNNNNRFRQNPSRPDFNARNPQRPSTQGPSNVFCRYCKTVGHDISSCKKREYNNQKYNLNQNRNNQNSFNKPPSRVNFVDQPEEEIDTDEVDPPSEDLNE